MLEGLGYYSRCRNLLGPPGTFQASWGPLPGQLRNHPRVEGRWTLYRCGYRLLCLQSAPCGGGWQCVYRVLARVFDIETPTGQHSREKYSSHSWRLILLDKPGRAATRPSWISGLPSANLSPTAKVAHFSKTCKAYASGRSAGCR